MCGTVVASIGRCHCWTGTIIRPIRLVSIYVSISTNPVFGRPHGDSQMAESRHQHFAGRNARRMVLHVIRPLSTPPHILPTSTFVALPRAARLSSPQSCTAYKRGCCTEVYQASRHKHHTIDGPGVQSIWPPFLLTLGPFSHHAKELQSCIRTQKLSAVLRSHSSSGGCVSYQR